MRAITSRLEINVNKTNAIDPIEVVDFAKRHGCVSIVVDPAMFEVFYLTKIKRNYTGALGVLVDFPHGNLSGISKLSQLPENVINVDCMDVMIRPNMQKVDYKKEIKFLTETVSNFISSTTEVRPVVNFSRGDEKELLSAIKDINVTRIRIENTKSVTTDELLKQIATVREYTPRPLVLAGKIDLSVIRDTMKVIGINSYYAVSFDQAKKIVKDAQSQVSIDDIILEPDVIPATISDLHTIVKLHSDRILQEFPGSTDIKVVTNNNNNYIAITSTEKSDVESIKIDIHDTRVEAKVKFV